MRQLPGFYALFLGMALSWLALSLLLPFLQHILLDHPNDRSVHRMPTPRGGGLAFVLVGSLLAPFSGGGKAAWIPLLCCPLAFVGLLDDRFDLPATVRFFAQILTSFVLIKLAIPETHWLLIIFLIFAITAIINFVNFMDGINGLVAANIVIYLLVALIASYRSETSASFAYPLTSLLPLIGAIIGFLPFNWNPAKVFMGDVGSTFLGAVVAGITLQQENLFVSFCMLMVAFPLLGDAGFCVLRRLAARQPVFQAHRLHLFQRLVQAGWSHQSVTLMYSLASLLLGVGFLYLGPYAMAAILTVVMLSGFYLDQNVATPFEVS